MELKEGSIVKSSINSIETIYQILYIKTAINKSI